MGGEIATFAQLYDVVSKIGFPGLLLLVLWGNYRRYFYWRWYVEELRAEKDEWKSAAKQTGQIADTALRAPRRS